MILSSKHLSKDNKSDHLQQGRTQIMHILHAALASKDIRKRFTAQLLQDHPFEAALHLGLGLSLLQVFISRSLPPAAPKRTAFGKTFQHQVRCIDFRTLTLPHEDHEASKATIALLM